MNNTKYIIQHTMTLTLNTENTTHLSTRHLSNRIRMLPTQQHWIENILTLTHNTQWYMNIISHYITEYWTSTEYQQYQQGKNITSTPTIPQQQIE